jgi:mono/diheme cytochrome c family protein
MIRGTKGSWFSKAIGGAAVAAVAVIGVSQAAHATGDAAKGKAAYEANCASCHGNTGAGDGPIGAALPEPKPRNFQTAQFKYDTDKDGKTGSEVDLKNVVKNALMAGWAQLGDGEIDNIVAYVRSLKK